MDQLKSILDGRIPPGLFRVVKKVGAGIHRFSMITPDEPVLVGVSGGKDSGFLSLALAIRMRWLPEGNPLTAALIEWKEYPLSELDRETLSQYFEILGVRLEILRATMQPPSFKGKFDCYLCARNRKRILFDFARSNGITTVALGHNMDDFIETTLINMAMRGQFATMMPVQEFFGGKLRIVRPLCLVKEHTIERLCSEFHIPVSQIDCPRRQKNVRSQFKPIVRQLVHLNKHAREHIFNSCMNISREYLPVEQSPDIRSVTPDT
ncbi:MAG: adenine nucleotide alpha hydrolase [Spirochaetales bacterium]|nr:adenine nucleotide alpha hydrolase [Spirochaetales bacterium]